MTHHEERARQLVEARRAQGKKSRTRTLLIFSAGILAGVLLCFLIILVDMLV